MSEVSDMIQRYKEIRLRLRYPPNAVPDTGINLKRRAEPPPAPLPQPPAPPPPVMLPAPLPPIPETPIPGITFSSTLAITAKTFGLSFDQIRSKSRTQKICLPRQIAIYLAAKQEKWSMNRIGHYLNLDHTTCLYAKRKIASMIESDPSLRDCITTIENKLATFHSPTPFSSSPASSETPTSE